jgi:hypothetical protein
MGVYFHGQCFNKSSHKGGNYLLVRIKVYTKFVGSDVIRTTYTSIILICRTVHRFFMVKGTVACCCVDIFLV